MSTVMDIRESETGVVRVFHLDLPPEAIERFTVQAGTGEWPLMYGMGAKKLSAAFIDVVRIADLGSMPLSSYLAEAHGVPPEALAPDAARLDKLRGHVLILPSQAFARTAQTLSIRTPLRWIATYEETKGRTMAAPLRSKAARGVTGTRTQAATGLDPAVLRWVLIAAGVVLAAALVWLLTGG